MSEIHHTSGNDLSSSFLKNPSVNLPCPLISVVTPSFNQVKYLEQTVNSILLQGYPNLEYIIMDGGSIDGSIDIIKKYESQLSYWESNPDKGQYDAIQKGFERSSGEIMAYLNSDDLYFPWTLQVVGEIFAKFPSVEWLTTSNVTLTTYDGRFNFGMQIYNRSSRWFYGTRGKRFKSRGFMPQESTFWRRSLWDKAGAKLKTDLKYAGDLELWSRFYRYASPVMINVPLGVFRYHQEQKTAQIKQYIKEGNEILSRFPNPVWIPPLGIQVLNSIFRLMNGQGNWLGARCDKIRYDPRTGDWVYKKYLEWRD